MAAIDLDILEKQEIHYIRPKISEEELKQKCIDILSSHPKYHNIKVTNYFIEKVKLFPSWLAEIQVHKTPDFFGDWINIYATQIRSYFGKNYATIKYICDELGWLHENPKYIPSRFRINRETGESEKGFSKSFKIREAAKYIEWKHDTIRYQKNIEKFKNVVSTSFENNESDELSHQQAVDSSKKKLDLKRVSQEIYNMKSVEGKKLNNSKRLYYLMKAQTRAKYDVLSSFRDKNGRLYTMDTFLPSILRPYLYTDDDEKFVSIDIRGSQVQFFISEVMKQLKPTQEIKSFIQLFAKSDPYAWMITNLEGAKKLRSDVKEQFFAEIFYSKMKRESKFCKSFKNDFPTIYSFIKSLKSKDYKDFPNKMQAIESKTMVDAAYVELKKMHPDAIITTRHDEIEFPIDIAGDAEKVLRRAFKKICGFIPAYRIKGINVRAKTIHRPPTFFTDMLLMKDDKAEVSVALDYNQADTHDKMPAGSSLDKFRYLFMGKRGKDNEVNKTKVNDAEPFIFNKKIFKYYLIGDKIIMTNQTDIDIYVHPLDSTYSTNDGLPLEVLTDIINKRENSNYNYLHSLISSY